LVTSSGGNAGLAATYAASKLKLPITVVVPTSTGTLVINKLKSSGAQVIVHGAAWDEADQEARKLCSQIESCFYVHPFDHPLIWNGHASIVDEILDQFVNGETPDCIIASVGGGGLLCGIIEGLIKHDLISKGIDIIAAETDGANCFNESVKQGKIVTLDKISSIAKTLGAKTCAKRLYELYLEHSKQIKSLVVTDKDAVDACLRFLDDHRILAEISCGAALALAYNMNKLIEKRYKNIVVIVCGGSGISLDELLVFKNNFKL
jgi:L-serine/L-threonine ammonia-lyase